MGTLRDLLFGSPLASDEEGEQRVGFIVGIPMLGLDALSSAAYGPEAAMTLLIPLGALSVHFVGPITAIIVLLLLIVYFSYLQTIGAYPGGGGWYTVASQNLGAFSGQLAASALLLDYVLVVAVGISAGVGALVSAVPSLQPHALVLCLVVLALIATVNLRGVRESGLAFVFPTYLFVACLGTVLAIGLVKTWLSGGHPAAVVAPPVLPAATSAASVWLLLRAFASGCTAMTGVEAVSNGITAFREPAVKNARRALTGIIGVLVVLLAGIAYLASAYQIGATEPGVAGYQSVLSLLVAAVAGRGWFYYVTMAGILAVLALSANTGFADFPRLCRLLGQRGIPATDLRVARTTSGVLARHLRVDGAVRAAAHHLRRRDRPADSALRDRGVSRVHAFAGGHGDALAACRRGASPAGHAHQRTRRGGHGRDARDRARRKVCRRRLGDDAARTGIAGDLRRRAAALPSHGGRDREPAPLNVDDIQTPIVIIPMREWNKMSQKGLRFALKLSPDIYVVQVRTGSESEDDLQKHWAEYVERPTRASGFPTPVLVTLPSPYRHVFNPLHDFIMRIRQEHPDRQIAVLVPELVARRWYHHFLHNKRAAMLKAMLLVRGDENIVVVNVPWYLSA